EHGLMVSDKRPVGLTGEPFRRVFASDLQESAPRALRHMDAADIRPVTSSQARTQTRMSRLFLGGSARPQHQITGSAMRFEIIGELQERNHRGCFEARIFGEIAPDWVNLGTPDSRGDASTRDAPTR